MGSCLLYLDSALVASLSALFFLNKLSNFQKIKKVTMDYFVSSRIFSDFEGRRIERI